MGGATLGEDPYQSDLVDPDAETAKNFRRDGKSGLSSNFQQISF